MDRYFRVQNRQKYKDFRDQADKSTTSTLQLNRSVFVSQAVFLARHDINKKTAISNLACMIMKKIILFDNIFLIFKFLFNRLLNSLELEQFYSSSKKFFFRI